MKEILQYVVVPIITALITALITYLSTKANNKTQVELAIKDQEIKLQELNNEILLKDKEIEQLKLNHELELKSKEADVTNPIMGEYLKEIIKDPSKINELTKLQKTLDKFNSKGGEIMSLKANLASAKVNKNDEFYTQLKDIENELKHYKDYFKGKVVYCNADDPRVSNFFHYFSYNFDYLGLKKLITTCYKNQEMNLFSMHDQESAIALVYEGEKDGGLVPTVENIGTIDLKGDGDFRSPEAIEFLKEADIVVTNPPFSLFREYLGQLMEYEKDFIILGNQNAMSYRDIFPLIMENKVWLGYNTGTQEFVIPEDAPNRSGQRVDENGIRYQKFGNIAWYTNLDIDKRHEKLPLFKAYNPEDHPKYDNYNAINVGSINDIPVDYDGIMGVPISYIDKYNPEQFEILGINTSFSDDVNYLEAKPTKKYIGAKQVSRKGKISNGSKINDSSALLHKEIPNKTYYTVDDIEGYLTITYARVFIRKRSEK